MVPYSKSGGSPAARALWSLSGSTSCAKKASSTVLPVLCSKAAIISRTASSSAGAKPSSHHTTRSAARTPSGASASAAARRMARTRMMPSLVGLTPQHGPAREARQRTTARRPYHPSVLPDAPEGRERDEELQEALDAAQATPEEGG